MKTDLNKRWRPSFQLMWVFCWPSVLPSLVGVAVAKCSNKNVIMGNLEDRRSCHGYMYSPAGWLLPHRHTLSLTHNSSSSCDPTQGTISKSLRGVLIPHTKTFTEQFSPAAVSRQVCLFSVQWGVLERLSSWLWGESVQSLYGRHRGGCKQALHWQPQWALLWQHGGFKVQHLSVYKYF